ncbi:MAG: c-type cytochrome [Bradyrhizobium sp.]
MSAKCRCDGNAPVARAFIALLICATPVFPITYESLAADNNRGAQLAAICAACHRLDGRDKGIPSIIGLDEEKLADALQAIKSGKRSIMHTVALSLSSEEIATVVHYLAAQRKETERP